MEYTLLLTRFCIFPRHLLLISKAFIPQSKDLDANDLSAVWNVLEETKDDADYLVFYNCGKESGCSQGHFHVQFVELSDGRLEDGVRNGSRNGVDDSENGKIEGAAVDGRLEDGSVNGNGIDADGTGNGREVDGTVNGREVDGTENAHSWMSSLRVFAQSPSISEIERCSERVRQRGTQSE